MTGSTSLLVLLLLLAAVLVWLLGRGPRHRMREPDDVDREVLEEAEEEVSGLDAFASPDDADDQLPDWGPGAPH
jgi:hypothetical protein